MNIILLLFPLSIIIIIIFYIIFVICFFNIYGIILCFLSIIKLISIKPIIIKINDIIYDRYKYHFDRIKQNIRETFIVKGNMDNTKQAIYILHPHGICSLTHVFHINTTITNWPVRNIYSIISYIIDYIPFLNDFVNDNNHMIISNYSCMKKALKTGKSISVALGNYTEGQYDDEHRITVIVKKRKGIFKMAIETGVPIIPVLSYGEQSIFKKSNIYRISELFYKISGIRASFPDISSIINWLTIYKKPHDKKVITYIGDPIDVGEAKIPSLEDIHILKKKYMKSLQTLYLTTKPENYDDDIVFV